LAEMGPKIEELFEHPQDIEWAYEKSELFVLQSRKIKGLKS
jgi:phosphoenolpyruvate synthase/pyruvate phosphate dikinase